MKPYLLALSMTLLLTASCEETEPNQLTRQYCASMKELAFRVSGLRDLGMTQNEAIDNFSEVGQNFAGTKNYNFVARTTEAVIIGAWMSEQTPREYSELVHETCLEEIDLVP